MEKIQELKKLLYIQEKELVKLKIMIKSIIKDVSNTKDILKKVELIISYLASLHYSNS